MQDIFRTIIITAQDVDVVRNIAGTLDSNAIGMFTTPLTPDGVSITHYISTGFLNEMWGIIVPCKFWGMNETGEWIVTHETAGNLDTIHAQCVANNIDITIEELTAIWNNSDVSDQEPFTALHRLNLQIYNEPIDE